ncbi:uncharacterized protein LOC129216721 [Uloborus diversus]|uniref:uncharacterized protein LOC129216721 n=1 Tax=Uloborus diversus TaxID=327109 RepID=UPI002409AB60|nr:uncharacterized protein LOC129216721 [Uloborus diversus]
MSEMDPVFGKRLLENPEYLVHGVPEGMDLVLKGGYAFVYLRFVLKWYAAVMGVERFRQSKNVFLTEAIGIALQKCHPCKMSFDHIVNRLEEAGVFGKWYDDAIIKARIRAAPSHLLRVRPLSLNDLQGAFYFLGICLSAAAVILGVEIVSYVVFCFRKKYSKKKKHSDKTWKHHPKNKFFRTTAMR